MARILQIRRGTTAQNDNFTGLPGEITFDTDAKTLRVHDGATLGGYALSRAGTPGAGDAVFDINSVTDEFWTDLFARMTPPAITTISASPAPILDGRRIEYVFNTDKTPILARASLVCQNAVAGYAVGDVVDAFGIGAYGAPMMNTFRDATGLHVVLFVGDGPIWVRDKTTGSPTNINSDDWQIVFRLYC